MFKSLLGRRQALKLLAGTAVLPALLSATPVAAAQKPLRAFILSDLHSAYERMGQLLATIESQIAAKDGPYLILLNGDLFESGNVVATRSGGEIDWAFLAALAKLAPTVVNIGNHEPDLDNDLANFVTRARGLGVTVLSNIVDKRAGAPYTQASAHLTLNGQSITIAGFATDAVKTYPKATRDMLDIPQPVEWAKKNLPGILGKDSINIVLSHAGVVADRDILPILPDGTLIVGGHDHLNLTHEQGATRYVHTGSWSTAITVATLAAPGTAAMLQRIEIDSTGAPSAALKDLIPAVLARHLTDEDRAIVGKNGKTMPVDEVGRFVADLMARKVKADVGFVGHTSFGAGLPQGEVSRYSFNSSVRFDGKLMRTEVDAAVLAAILARCNQEGDIPLAARTGDYLHAAPVDQPKKERYTLVCNDWSAINQKSYFGREDLVFSEVADAKLKQVVLDTLAAG
ncbi:MULTISPECIES: metallophosphoesterase [unclassified Rhizobium]|jgi:2',3'-cyclic-nucleotide 2'-phosphodiesterase (5'-nucleotidase family)|uniref:metallophosphoesterase n=1 Tax=unclassified Rhizobium TaxID=2613769 RepID=UPI000647B40E|nr:MULTISPECIES: metallophosphoesterase [unclassified Rhizobium]MBN8950214.1 bifunctional metallophosphatase/5'-nucleotidase [Rhizobium tropici]OJY68769.1 MAG: serine/threonine protein phosphatase [Rhizobium sp. 60-20]RKD74488.1 2',3'-cyclic-nucleotide 2'-phosphodiesterase (5'-nucleotidase family) [Rhizobium sp. WW_1]